MKRLVPVLATLVAVLAVPSAASAVPAMSQVFQPSAFTAYEFNASNPTQQSFSVSGTANFDPVDIRCDSIWGNSVLLKEDVPASGGTFATTVDVTDGYACTLHAVLPNSTPSDFTNFIGRPISMNVVTRNSANGKDYDYYAFFGQKLGAYDYDSLTSCGIDDSYLIDPATYLSTVPVFYCNQFIGGDMANTRSSLQIDGRNAFASAQNDDLTAVAGFQSFGLANSTDPSTGDTTITETQALMACPTDAWPPTPGNCGSISTLPVRFVRTITQDHDGRVATIRDRYESTDAQAHTMSVGYWQSLCLTNSCTDHITYTAPNGATVADPGSDAVVNGPFADGSTMTAVDTTHADGDMMNGRAAITLSPGADNVAWSWVRRSLVTWKDRMIPAGGAYSIVGRFAQAFSSSELSTLTADPVSGGGASGGPASIAKAGKASVAYSKKKRTVSLATGDSVACPAGGSACTVTATLSTKYKKGKKTKTYKFKKVTLTIQPGSSAPVIFKISSVKNNPLYKGSSKKGFKPVSSKKFTFTGAITASATGTPDANSAVSFKLRLPKIPKKK